MCCFSVRAPGNTIIVINVNITILTSYLTYYGFQNTSYALSCFSLDTRNTMHFHRENFHIKENIKQISKLQIS